MVIHQLDSSTRHCSCLLLLFIQWIYHEIITMPLATGQPRWYLLVWHCSRITKVLGSNPNLVICMCKLSQNSGKYRFARSNSVNGLPISFSCVRVQAVLPLQLLLRFKFRIRPFNFVLSRVKFLKHSVQFSVASFFFVTHTSQEASVNLNAALMNC